MHTKCSFLLLPFCRLLLLAVKHLSDYFLNLMKDPHQPISGSMFTVGYGRKCNLRLSNSSGGATICKLRQVDVRNSCFYWVESSNSFGVNLGKHIVKLMSVGCGLAKDNKLNIKL